MPRRNDLGKAELLAASIGKLEEFQKELGGEEAMDREVQKGAKEEFAKRRAESEIQKKHSVQTTTDMHEKKLELMDLERQLAPEIQPPPRPERVIEPCR